MKQQQKIYQDIILNLRSTLGLLDLEPNSQLQKDVISICEYLENSSYKIAVFGPFNHGKSTLLNALLGEKALPIDLIPTTGAAIYVRYGTTLHSKIIFKDGTEKSEAGTKILKSYAILNEQRCMRDDVAAVEVYCSHPWLKTGVEFIDLPGTNDREAQNNLVKDRLLAADLIVQVLDARKLMTLEERENLNNWLIERGIKTVIFVVNFVNLLAPQEQKEIELRLRYIAESFRSKLPPGISNLYRVDALPALRSRLKGDTSGAQTTGLAAFETALQNIVDAQKTDLNLGCDRLAVIIKEVKKTAKIKGEELLEELAAETEKAKQKNAIQNQAEKLIKAGLQTSISEFKKWLNLADLLTCYETELTAALQEDILEFWQLETLQPKITKYQQEIDEWLNKGCDFFDNQYPGKLLIEYPNYPEITFLEAEANEIKSEDNDIATVAIPAGLGFVLGGPVGAAVLGGASYFLNKAANQEDSRDKSQSESEPANIAANRAYRRAARQYLASFSRVALDTVDRYHKQALSAVTAKASESRLQQSKVYHKLQLLINLTDSLQNNLNKVNPKLF